MRLATTTSAPCSAEQLRGRCSDPCTAASHDSDPSGEVVLVDHSRKPRRMRRERHGCAREAADMAVRGALGVELTGYRQLALTESCI